MFHVVEAFVIRVVVYGLVLAALVFGLRWAMGQRNAVVVGDVSLRHTVAELVRAGYG